MTSPKLKGSEGVTKIVSWGGFVVRFEVTRDKIVSQKLENFG